MPAKEMTINALAGWFGGKRELAPTIVEWLGPHKSYVEPFCGSMAVLLAKPQVQFEVVNDLHGDIINLALTVQHDQWGPWLYLKLRRVLYSEVAFSFAQRRICQHILTIDPDRVNEDSALRAYYYYFIVCWMGRSGTAGTDDKGHFTLRYTAKGGNQAQRFQGAIRSIPAWRRRLRSVTILCRDGFKLIEKLKDEPGQAIYVDPPYLVKNGDYLHDFHKADHNRLARLLWRFKKSRVVVSYYDHPLLAQLYPETDWRKVDCTRRKHMNQQTEHSKHGKAAEVLLVNRSSIHT